MCNQEGTANRGKTTKATEIERRRGMNGKHQRREGNDQQHQI